MMCLHRTTLLPSIFFLMIRAPPRSTLLPFTTLFRPVEVRPRGVQGRRVPRRAGAHDHHVVRFGHPKYPFYMRVFNLYYSKDRKSTRLNSSHANISYAVFCLKKKNNTHVFITHLASHF